MYFNFYSLSGQI